jgi:hypothetical protein
MEIDTTAAARGADAERLREWLAGQRVFVSSAMGDTAAERRAVAAAIEEEGARAVWFEEFGRDADAEEAYLTEIDSSTIYLGLLNERYGRLNPPHGFSATEAEYLRAREGGKRVHVLVAAPAPAREGHLSRFIDRVRYCTTTENYADVDDLVRRVRRRLHELGAEALSPWVKLGDFVFRADHVDEDAATVTIRARVSDDIAYQLETLRDQRYGRRRLRFVHRSRVVEAELANLRRTTHAGGADELTIELTQARPAETNAMRAGTSGRSADDLVELGLRALFLGEPLPDSVTALGFMTDPGIDLQALRQAFEQPNETAEAVTRLVVTDGLVGGGNARRVVALHLGPRNADTRKIALEWEEPRTYANIEPTRRRLEGDWHPAD